LRRHKKNGDKKWDEETEKNTDVPTYTADIPAGYGGAAKAAANATDAANATAAASLSIGRRPSQKTLVGMRQR